MPHTTQHSFTNKSRSSPTFFFFTSLRFWIMEDFFSLDICFPIFFFVFFWVRKLIIYRFLICFFFRCFFTWFKSFFFLSCFHALFLCKSDEFHNCDELNGNLMKMQLNKSNITVFSFCLSSVFCCWLCFKLAFFLLLVLKNCRSEICKEKRGHERF